MPKRGIAFQPKYRLHKQSGDAIVTIESRDYKLGPHGSRESLIKYDRLIAEWKTGGRSVAPPPEAKNRADDPGVLKVFQIASRFMEYANVTYFHPNGRPTGSAEMYRYALRDLCKRFANHPADEFGQLELEAFRQGLINDGGKSLYTVNKVVKLVKTVFRWAEAKDLYPFEKLRKLERVKSLERHIALRGKEDVPPVADEVIEATLPCLSPVVRAMVKIQRLTGARPGEICNMTLAEIDRRGTDWIYAPKIHKTAYKGQSRMIPLGPKCQEILQPFLSLNPTKPLFSPRESRDWHRDQRRVRGSGADDEHAGDDEGSKPSPKRAPGETFNTGAYSRAITVATEKAFPLPAHLGKQPKETAKAYKARLTPPMQKLIQAWRRQHHWAPNQIRHTKATEVRAKYGLDAAQAVLGHAKIETTQIYARRNDQLAIELARQLG